MDKKNEWQARNKKIKNLKVPATYGNGSPSIIYVWSIGVTSLYGTPINAYFNKGSAWS